MIAAILYFLRQRKMDRFRAEVTADGSQTYILDKVTGETFAICVGREHASNARRLVIDLNRGERFSNPLHSVGREAGR